MLLLMTDGRWLERMAVPQESIAAVVDVSGVVSFEDVPFRWLVLPLLLGFNLEAWRDFSPVRFTQTTIPASSSSPPPALPLDSTRLPQMASHSSTM